MEDSYLEVYFDVYCKTCTLKDKPETDKTCDECLGSPVNLNSHKPIKWEEKKK